MEGYEQKALLIIDMQVGAFSVPNRPVYKAKELFDNINNLRRAFHDLNQSVIFIQHIGKDKESPAPDSEVGKIHPAVKPTENELILFKRFSDSFYKTLLNNELRARKIKELYITGVASEYCVDTACRRAFSSNFDVILVKDGHSTLENNKIAAPSIIEHHNQVVESWFGKVLSTSAVIHDLTELYLNNLSLTIKT